MGGRLGGVPRGVREQVVQDLFGADRLAAVQLPRQRQLVEGNLPAVGAPAGHHLEHLLRGAARCVQARDHPLRLSIQRRRIAGPGIEDHDAYRRGLDQDLQVGSGPLLVPVRARVGDRRRRLRREQHQDLFVIAGELPAAFLAAEQEVADNHSPMPQRRSQEGRRRHHLAGQVERSDVAAQVRHSQRARQVPEVFQKLQRVGKVQHLATLVRGEAGGDEVLGPPRVIDSGERAHPGAGERAGALHDLKQDGLEVQTCADAQDGGLSLEMWSRSFSFSRLSSSGLFTCHPRRGPEQTRLDLRHAAARWSSRVRSRVAVAESTHRH